MTKQIIAKLAIEFYNSNFLHQEKYYEKYQKIQFVRGQMRTVESYRFTKEGKKIFDILCHEKVFTCPYCKEKKSANDLQIWQDNTIQDLILDTVPCSECYEEEMGDDL
jgi:hypothetical protein